MPCEYWNSLPMALHACDSSGLRFLLILYPVMYVLCKLLSNKDRIVDHNLTTILLFPMLSISEILERSNF